MSSGNLRSPRASTAMIPMSPHRMAFVLPLCTKPIPSHCSVRPSLTSRRRPYSTFHGARLATIPPPPAATSWRMNISSNDFRPGTTIELDGVVHRVLEFLHVKPGKGAAFVRTKLKNLKTGNNVEKTFKAGEIVPSAVLEKIVMQHTYVDGDDFVFMNMESYEEERMSSDVLGANVLKFLTIGLDVEVLKHNDTILGVDIPKTMSFVVTSTDPGIKGNTAQGGGTKPAIIETGAEVMVPLFIKTGERINVNTEDGKYLGRDNT